MKYSIGIVTYKDRFERWFKPLVTKIKKMKPDAEIIVQVNGDYPSGMDEQYRKDMLGFLSEHSSIYPFFWTSFRSLSKLWNHCLINASNNHVLVLNDDVDIWDAKFFQDVEHGIKNFGGSTFKINNSWSHFLANREEIEELHWFDETLLGVGNEDGDMQLRIEQAKGSMPMQKCNGVTNGVDYTNPLPGLKKVYKKYSAFNLQQFESKLDLSQLTDEEKLDSWSFRDKIGKLPKPTNPHPIERFWWENRDKL